MSERVLARRSLRDLLRPTVRVLPWSQLLGVGLLAGLLIAFVTTDDHLSVEVAVDRLRLLLPLFAVAVAAVLDDPTRPHLDTVPVRLAVRQGLRLALALPIVVLWWLALLVLAGSRVAGAPTDDDAGLPFAALTVLLWALVALALATTAVVTRRRGGHGGLPAAGVALVVPTVFAGFEPLRRHWFPPHPSAAFDPSSEEMWLAAHQRWAAVAVVATVVLLWALRDPARPPQPWRLARPTDLPRQPHRRPPRPTVKMPTGGTTR